MQRRDFQIGSWTYFLTAHGDDSLLEKALDSVQRFIEGAQEDDHPLGGMLEVEAVIVKIECTPF